MMLTEKSATDLCRGQGPSASKVFIYAKDCIQYGWLDSGRLGAEIDAQEMTPGT